jgi:hypothetical protein
VERKGGEKYSVEARMKEEVESDSRLDMTLKKSTTKSYAKGSARKKRERKREDGMASQLMMSQAQALT